MISIACALGCSRDGAGPGAAAAPARALADAESLLAKGEHDAALARLAKAGGGADVQLLMARAWIKKAETAPLPTPPPPPSPLPRNWEPEPPPELKPEEVEAVRRLEAALAADGRHAASHLALAQVLAPHAVRLHERARTGPKAKARKPPVTPNTGGVEVSAERVIAAYRGALAAAASDEAIEGLIRFAEAVDRPLEAEPALAALMERAKEKPEPFIRYGDFLRTVKKDFVAAADQYRQALVWRPDDEPTKAKLAGMYIDIGASHWTRREYGAAETNFREAAKLVSGRRSPEAARLAGYMDKLSEIRRMR